MNLRLNCARYPYRFSKQQEYLKGKIPGSCSNRISVHYYETSYVYPYISTARIWAGAPEGQPASFFARFSPRGARRRKSACGAHRCFELWSLDHPRGTAWTHRHESPLTNEKLRPPRCGVPQTICRLSTWCYEYKCMCIGVAGRGVMMWRGWGAHNKDRRRRKWWRSCRGSRETTIRMASVWLKIRRKQLKYRQYAKPGEPGLFKPKRGTMWGWPVAGFLACDLYLVLERTCFWHQSDEVDVPVFGKKYFICFFDKTWNSEFDQKLAKPSNEIAQHFSFSPTITSSIVLSIPVQQRAVREKWRSLSSRCWHRNESWRKYCSNA